MPSQYRERSTCDDERLTRLLARWVNAHRLTAGQSEAIRQEIVAEPVPSDFDWWWRLLSPSVGSAFRGLDAVQGWETAAAAYAPAIQQTTLWSTDVPVISAWDQDADDLQPYVRLT